MNDDGRNVTGPTRICITAAHVQIIAAAAISHIRAYAVLKYSTCQVYAVSVQVTRRRKIVRWDSWNDSEAFWFFKFHCQVLSQTPQLFTNVRRVECQWSINNGNIMHTYTQSIHTKYYIYTRSRVNFSISIGIVGQCGQCWHVRAPHRIIEFTLCSINNNNNINAMR